MSREPFSAWHRRTGGTFSEYEKAAEIPVQEPVEVPRVRRGARLMNGPPAGTERPVRKRRKFDCEGGLPARCKGCGARVRLATKPFAWCDPDTGYMHTCET